MKKMVLAAAVAALAFAAFARPEWKDSDQKGKNAEIRKLKDGSKLRVDRVAKDIFRVRRTKANVWTESGMNRYDIVKRLPSFDGKPDYAFNIGSDGSVEFKSIVSPAKMTIATELTGKGGNAVFPLTKDERIYGLGDVNRTCIQRRGNRYEIWVKNVNSYIPIPMIIARGGWGVFLNTTWRNFFDVGKTDPDAMRCEIPEGDLDFYVFVGRDYRQLLDAYTRLTGRPQLLPSFAYGFAYVCNQWIDEYEYMNEATWFNKLGMPIDIMGLEPGWMEHHYDHSTKKKWSKERFKSFPFWAPTGPGIFPFALNRMGINMSLWMCTDYDFYPYEEQCAMGMAKERGEKMEVAAGLPDTWVDPRIEKKSDMDADRYRYPVHNSEWERNTPTAVRDFEKFQPYNKIDKKYLDEAKYPEGALPWFRHLQKFCDQGARCWKLDGNLQVCQDQEHPGKIYGNGMHVDEAHNLYPVVYDKQMARGYEEYTGRRAMVYSAGGYAGVQAYVATWAGDTGGGERTLVSTLNLGISGHPNQSCDMTISSKVRMHYGFLAPWSQANDWDSFHRPWMEGDEAERSFRHYDELRYSLFPYIYASAAYSAKTGFPLARALPFVFPDFLEYDEVKSTYMFGEDLLVSAFSDVTEVPAGIWYDWRTGKRVVGPKKEPWDQNGVWGGGLFLREGAIVPRWEGKMHLPKGWDKNVIFEVWPLEKDGVTKRTWYEDDGDSLKYRDGEYTEAEVSCETKGEERIFRIAPQKGSFTNAPNSHYVKLRIRLEKRPVVHFGKYDWQTKLFEFDLGDVDAEKGVEFKLTTADRSAPVKAAKTLKDCAWMWGHDTGVYDGPGNGYNIPVSEKIAMPDACLKMGVPNCCGVRWSWADREYLEPFAKLRSFSWVLGSVYNNAFNYFLEHDFMMIDQMPNLAAFDLDDIFLDRLPPVKALDREGREIRVTYSRPSYAEILKLKDRMGESVCMQRLQLRAVLYARQIRPEIKPVLDLMDTVLFWTWDGKDISKLRDNFAKYREFLPEKPTLLGIYMWDFGGQCPMPAGVMRTQLDFALEKFRNGEIRGVIFHCTPLVNKNLEAVEICRKWLEEHGSECPKTDPSK